MPPTACGDRAVRAARRARVDGRRDGPARLQTLQFLLPMRVHLAVLAALALVACQSGRPPASLVVIGQHVVTGNAAGQVLSPGAVAIDGAAIIEVGEPDAILAKYAVKEVVDASSQIVL